MTEGRTHLTPGERCQIEVLLRRGDSQRGIARLLGRPASTLRREIKRNSGTRGYVPRRRKRTPMNDVPKLAAVPEK